MLLIIHDATRVVMDGDVVAGDPVPPGYSIVTVPNQSLFRAGSPRERGYWRLDNVDMLEDASASDIASSGVERGFKAILKEHLGQDLRGKLTSLRARNNAIENLPGNASHAALLAANKNQVKAFDDMIGALALLLRDEIGGDI